MSMTPVPKTYLSTWRDPREWVLDEIWHLLDVPWDRIHRRHGIGYIEYPPFPEFAHVDVGFRLGNLPFGLATTSVTICDHQEGSRHLALARDQRAPGMSLVGRGLPGARNQPFPHTLGGNGGDL